MKVCLLNDSFPPVIDGVANVVMNYGENLVKNHAAEVVVATPRYPGADYEGYPYRVMPYQSFDTTKLVKGYRTGNPFDVGEVNKLVEFAPEIIHTHCPFSSTILARLLKLRTNAPLILTYHTKFDVDIARAVKAKLLQEEAIRALIHNVDGCDEVWVVSNGAGENLRSLGYEGEYVVMNNGVDFAKGRVEEDFVAKAVGDYDLPQGVPVFLFVGRIIAYKGLPLILEALAKLKEKNLDYRMVFVGSGPDEAAMKEQAEKLGVMPRCIFTGAVSDRQKLRAWNTRADLFLFPSTYDTNGIVVREAAACGLASVLIEGSCAAEGITDGRNGYLIQENADAMAEVLSRACADLDHVHQVGQHAMDEIYISWEDSVKQAYERYQIVRENYAKGMYKSKLKLKEEQLRTYVQEQVTYTQEQMTYTQEQIRNYAQDLWEDIKELEAILKDK